jgi:hypothetical protein
VGHGFRGPAGWAWRFGVFVLLFASNNG